MWTPWTVVAGTVADWSRRTQEVAVENARAAAVECSRALVERIEVELYVAELNEQRVQQRERPSVIA
ncbi:hypothetical protein ISU07_12070 [Nocardioides islandensis]|jgi:hypothetical protein|uniref:Uncharacterized protein n=1 Tax=Nocardioides islandensis TaxID=433663 RepID=A0A930VCD6_9ACTN|nr:hypothetical protein [Nocardioides islandensis]MBF4763863.1 hypothetical protein [Nocardioides islandensis]